ncbi:hypothetical protein [Streptosporangium sp. NPDC048865]|uniref:hypothetical protein n=1 Tax=Streptosporangium sp. NPDC048865 TaxID=3155766 RepID=UPI00341741A7
MVALSGASVILSLGLSGLSTPAQAAVTSSNAEQGSVSTLANRCNYPTSARPGSTFVSSWTECTYCHYEELARQAVYPWRDYYCTYNPSNNLNDLHWKA